MSTGNDTDERDPYAPPPEGAPDRPPAAPWNLPGAGGSGGSDDSGSGGSGSGGSGGGGWGDPRSGDRRDRDRERRDEDRPPADPRRRNARIALWLGVWGLFFGFFLWEEAGIVMGVAAFVLGVRSLRGTSAPRVGPRVEQGPGGTARTPGRARRLARPARVNTAPGASTQGTVPRPPGALVGLVTGALAVVWVLGVWSFRWSQQDYYDCMDAGLTKQAQDECKHELPSFMRNMVDNLDSNPI
jgi:hypothetical protein